MDKYNRNSAPEGDETGDVISWIVIFILMIAFWPIGLLLLLRKLNVFAKPKKKTSGRYNDKAKDSSGNDGARYREITRDAENAVRDAETAAREAAREAESVAREVASDFMQAAREVGYAARHAVSEIHSEFTRDISTNDTSQTATAKSAALKSRVGQPAASGIPVPLSRKEKAKIKKARTALEKKSGKFISVVFLLISIALFILGANTIVGAARDIWINDMNRLPELYLGAFFLVGGLISFFSRNTSARRLARYRRYYVFVSERDVVPIPDIARTAGLSARVVKRDLQAMINEGFLSRDSYIDVELNCLVLSSEAAEEMRRTSKDSDDAPVEAADEKSENLYMAIILELREINSSISDISISEKIDRIESVTAKIFRIVEENPEKLPEIRRFMNYYLPTTLKLLRSYATLEKQGVKGENITTTKANIERILDTLATGFEQQLDQLFKSDALDIAADINVLENLMQQDGLTKEQTANYNVQSTNG